MSLMADVGAEMGGRLGENPSGRRVGRNNQDNQNSLKSHDYE